MRIALIVMWMLFAPSMAMAQEQPPAPKPPAGFVAIDEVPPGEQIPAINLVAAAYGFVWIAMMAYVWTLGRRIRTVETELADLEARKK